MKAFYADFLLAIIRVVFLRQTSISLDGSMVLNRHQAVLWYLYALLSYNDL